MEVDITKGNVKVSSEINPFPVSLSHGNIEVESARDMRFESREPLGIFPQK